MLPIADLSLSLKGPPARKGIRTGEFVNESNESITDRRLCFNRAMHPETIEAFESAEAPITWKAVSL